jgi:hypothetical protein
VNIQGKIIENFGNSTFQDIFMTMFFGTTKADYPCSSAVGAHFSIVLPRSMTDDFGNFGIAWEIKFDKLPKYLGRWRTPKTGGSHFGLKESDQ